MCAHEFEWIETKEKKKKVARSLTLLHTHRWWKHLTNFFTQFSSPSSSSSFTCCARALECIVCIYTRGEKTSSSSFILCLYNEFRTIGGEEDDGGGDIVIMKSEEIETKSFSSIDIESSKRIAASVLPMGSSGISLCAWLAFRVRRWIRCVRRSNSKKKWKLRPDADDDDVRACFLSNVAQERNADFIRWNNRRRALEMRSKLSSSSFAVLVLWEASEVLGSIQLSTPRLEYFVENRPSRYLLVRFYSTWFIGRCLNEVVNGLHWRCAEFPTFRRVKSDSNGSEMRNERR